jgi:hypothetical protein
MAVSLFRHIVSDKFFVEIELIIRGESSSFIYIAQDYILRPFANLNRVFNLSESSLMSQAKYIAITTDTPALNLLVPVGFANRIDWFQ